MATKKELEVENFNLKTPVGSKVFVTYDDGSKVETETTSKAYLLGGHTPVIHLQDVTGCYLLNRVKPC